MAGEEFHGPYSTWTQLSPSNDGTGATDYTNIQTALNNLRSGAGVVYLAAGTYFINQTLKAGIQSPSGQTVGLIAPMILGHSKSDTKIKWAGGNPNHSGNTNVAIMFMYNGVTQMRFGRLTLDGNNVANVGIMDAWDNSANYFPTANRFEDVAFINLNRASGQSGPQSETMGLALGVLGFGASETSIMRCSFNYTGNPYGGGNPVVVGAMTFNFNSLDNWFWDCSFVGPQEGICNVNDQDNYSGDFEANRCNFGCTERDLHFGNLAPNFSSRWCYSAPTGWRHWEAAGIGGFVSNVTVQGCTLNSKSAASVFLSNAGPIGLLDNVIATHGGGDTVAIEAQSAYNTDNGSGEEWGIGNSFQDPLSTAYFTSASTRVHSVDDLFGQGFTDPGYPTLYGEPPAVTRTIWDNQSSGGSIQSALNAASANDVIHISGTLNVSSTITVPANLPIYIEGDGQFQTKLQWSGGAGGPVLQFNLPSLAICRNFQIDGNGVADCVGASGTSTGGVIHLESCANSNAATVGGLRANGMNSTVVDLIATSMQVNPSSSTAYGVSSEGTSQVHWVGGTSGNGIGPMFQVLSGGKLVGCNIYAENGNRNSVLVASNCNGTLNLDGGRVVGGTVIADFSSFTGQPTLSNIYLSESCTGNLTLGNNLLMLGVTTGSATFPGPNPPWTVGSATQYAILSPRQQVDSSGQAFAISETTAGVSDQVGYIRTHLAPLRAVKPKDLVSSVPSGNTQLVFVNITTNNERLAFNLGNSFTGGGGSSSALIPWF